MALAPAQLVTLRAAIDANPTWAAYPRSADGYYDLARVLNAAATPAFVVWRPDVTAEETGNAWVGTDIDGMSSLNMQRLQLLLASSPSGVFDMRRADRRAGFENPFGASQNNPSRVAMRAAWKRSATAGEKVFATGTGSDADPGILVVVGNISPGDVEAARAL